MDKLVEKIAGFEFCYAWCRDVAYKCEEQRICAAFLKNGLRRHLKKATHITQLFLSDPDIVEIDRDAKVPRANYGKTLFGQENDGYYEGMVDMGRKMFKVGWVLPKKEKK